MSHHTIPIRQRRCRRAPALFNPCLEHLIRLWHMVPHGDRRYRSQSGGAEYQGVISPGNYCVVRELVLNHDVGDDRRFDRAGRLTATPAKDVGQRLQPTELAL